MESARPPNVVYLSALQVPIPLHDYVRMVLGNSMSGLLLLCRIPMFRLMLRFISCWWNPAKLYREKASNQATSPTKVGPQGGKGTTKNRTLHQKCGAALGYLVSCPRPFILQMPSPQKGKRREGWANDLTFLSRCKILAVRSLPVVRREREERDGWVILHF